ncbi:hypothetical protein FH972_020307 [Carpinus fangiana]|uniref:Cytochrome b561 and DOMON domain-containing protein n=1 Tax=Carpinus fangiana TaxID=176857 RepID=A0A5N6RSW5_9ROSI|nr:hypothetical protein FH972_020307 [Carpinus fangiana]
MSSSTKPAILSTLAYLSLFFSIALSSCSDGFNNKAKDVNITNCKELTTLGAEFGWSYTSSGLNGTKVHIILGARLQSEMGWLAWGVNPGKRPQMVGTRAVIGIRQQNKSLVIKTYNITKDTKLGCQLLPSDNIGVEVSNAKIEYMQETSYLVIHAAMILPLEKYNISELNHVWQVGHYAEDLQPAMHPTALQNVDSTETIDLATGHARSAGHHRRHLRMVHGILNMVGWGTLLPVGVIIARYSRRHPIKYRHWFVLHAGCQITGYVLGTTGWAIGLWLGHASKYYTFHTHRLLAMFIFTFTTLQMLALRFRLKENDEYRKHWNMYHHFLGYALLATIAVNIFQGIAILEPNRTWKSAYIGILGSLAAITLAFEVFTWAKFLVDKKRSKNTQPKPL